MTAGYSPKKNYTNDIRDKDTGVVFSPVPNNEVMDDIKIINGKPFAPSRRHFTIEQFTDELSKYGFRIAQDISRGLDEWGSLVVVTIAVI